MQTENYRANLREALETLIKVNNQIFHAIIGVGMAGELKEWNDTLPGETHELSFELFRNLDDANLKLLTDLMLRVEETYDSIQNLNGINEKT